MQFMSTDIFASRLKVLVVERTSLVAMDLQQEVLSHAPSAEVRLARSAAEALGVLGPDDSYDLAFWGLAPVDAETRSALNRLRAVCDRVVVMGDAVEEESVGATLITPFSARAIAPHLLAAAAARSEKF